MEQAAPAATLAPARTSELNKAQAATAKYAKASAAERQALGYQALQMGAPPGMPLESSRSGGGVGQPAVETQRLQGQINDLTAQVQQLVQSLGMGKGGALEATSVTAA